MPATLRAIAMPLAILALTALGVTYVSLTGGYAPFVLALVALTAVVGVGLNILLGLTGQVSLGHVGFYAIGAYTVAILTGKGVDFWIAFPLAGIIAGAVGFVLALPALRVSGPYLAMVTIAFAFIIQHGATEWRDLTGGANGLMNIKPPAIGGKVFAEREMAILSILLAGASLYFFYRLSRSAWGKGMVAVRDAEIAARSIGLNPVIMKTSAFALSAVFTGLAGAIFAPLFMFVAPDSFPFSQSILFLLAVIVGGAGWVMGPVVGAAISVIGPELLSALAEYRLLFFGALLLIVLWLAPEGVLGTLARFAYRRDPRAADGRGFDVAAFIRQPEDAQSLALSGVSIAFGGIKAATDVSLSAEPGKITSVIGPNGAGKTTVLNIIGGFYRPDSGSVRLAGQELAGAPAWTIARAGIARTYQTTKLFASMSVLDNVLVAMHCGRLGGMLVDAASAEDSRAAEALLAFVGYHGALATPASDLPHVDRRLVEIARALAMRPRVLLLDEPAAGLMRADKDALSRLLRRIADLGVAVILVEHDMVLVMGISDHVVVLDAGQCIANGAPAAVRAGAKEKLGAIDFLVHSLAFANRDYLKKDEGNFTSTPRDVFRQACDISAYSLIALTRAALPLMPEGGSVVALTYLGSEKVIPGYNIMGVAKAALEASARYLAFDLGAKKIRVNTLSAGPVKTLAAMAVGGIDEMFDHTARKAPLKRNIDGDEVGKTAVYLLSDLSSGVTGENIYVDSGFNTVGL